MRSFMISVLPVGVGGDPGAGEVAVEAVFLAQPCRPHRLDAIGDTGSVTRPA